MADRRPTSPRAGAATTPTASIRNLLVVVAVVAVDCSLVESWSARNDYFRHAGWPYLFRLAFAGSLPMANAVLVGGDWLLPGRGEGRPFLTGFVLSGAVAIFAALGLAAVLPVLLPWDGYRPLGGRINREAAWVRRSLGAGLSYKSSVLAVELAMSAVLFTIPELLVALRAGFRAKRRAHAGR